MKDEDRRDRALEVAVMIFALIGYVSLGGLMAYALAQLFRSIGGQP